MRRRTFLQLAAAPVFAQGAKSAAGTPWTQWGGPNRNFQTEATGLKEQWPASGPKVVWKRPLGEGYSSAAVENNVLYTMYGRPREEVVVACDAGTGKTLWEHATPMTFSSDAAPDMGNGPYSTPLIVGERMFTTGVAGRLQSIEKKSGKLLWTQQLWQDHKGTRLMYGYSSSPIAYKDTVIVPVGGPGRAVMAFRQHDGSVAWARNDFGNAYSSPLLIDVNGLRTRATEVWSSNRLRLHHGNAMRIGETLYFSSGGKGSVAIFTAVDAPSGKILWQDRSIAKATFVWADQKLITLDGDGNLMVVHPSPTGFKVAARAELLTSLSWTPPSLVGTRLYIRDRRNMMAVDLG